MSSCFTTSHLLFLKQTEGKKQQLLIYTTEHISKMTGNIPVDMINLRLILVSGKTKEFLFSPNDSAADIAKHVYDNWPMDWEEEQVSSPNILRLIYQGRFLHGNVTLGGKSAFFMELGRKGADYECRKTIASRPVIRERKQGGEEILWA
uniref:Ubiquitin-like protein 3 n=2 Tax=Cyprinus carpio TaxID=7962 RepID=A0A9J8CG54_CYPCA